MKQPCRLNVDCDVDVMTFFVSPKYRFLGMGGGYKFWKSYRVYFKLLPLKELQHLLIKV